MHMAAAKRELTKLWLSLEWIPESGDILQSSAQTRRLLCAFALSLGFTHNVLNQNLQRDPRENRQGKRIDQELENSLHLMYVYHHPQSLNQTQTQPPFSADPRRWDEVTSTGLHWLGQKRAWSVYSHLHLVPLSDAVPWSPSTRLWQGRGMRGEKNRASGIVAWIWSTLPMGDALWLAPSLTRAVMCLLLRTLGQNLASSS